MTDSDQIRHGNTCEEGRVARGSGTSHPNEAGPVLLKFMGRYLTPYSLTWRDKIRHGGTWGVCVSTVEDPNKHHVWHASAKFHMVIKLDGSKNFIGSTMPRPKPTIFCDTNADARSVCGKVTFLFSAAIRPICRLS